VGAVVIAMLHDMLTTRETLGTPAVTTVSK
jgi:hypothetical protein